jgi:hypothetical protein
MLLHETFGKFGEAKIIGRVDQMMSNGYALDKHHRMMKVAYLCGVTEEQMFKAKMSSCRAVHVDEMFERYEDMIKRKPNLLLELKAAGL